MGERERFDNVPNFQTSDGTMHHSSDDPALDIRFVGELSSVTLKPGDMLVLRIDSHIDNVQLARIEALMTEKFGGHRCVVISNGATLEVLSPEAV